MASSLQPPILFSPLHHTHLLPFLVAIHIACITTDSTIATFLPPLTHKQPAMTAYWQTRIDEIASGLRHIIIQLSETGELAGFVSLYMPPGETGPFRGSVEKLLVSPEWRMRGVARAVMGKLEVVARGCGRTLLMLDTETGSPAELVYPRLGYIQVGIIPDFGISPDGGTLKGNTIFYKNLLTKENRD